MTYLVWDKTFDNMKFVDVWNIEQTQLRALPGVELTIHNALWNSVSVMFKVQSQKSIIDCLKSMGATEYQGVS